MIPVTVVALRLRRRMAADQNLSMRQMRQHSTKSLLWGELLWVVGHPFRAVRGWRRGR
ncbi:MAG: hypothetical protein ACR2KP_05785 [Egibacteraceae bacterium]